MKEKTNWKRIIYIIGVISLVIGFLDPLEGSVVIAFGSFLIAISTYLTKDRHWKIFFASLIMIIVGVFLPVEICDYYLSHFGGNKHRVRQSGDEVAYEKAMQQHWMFFLITSPPVVIFGLIIVFLAVTKPF